MLERIEAYKKFVDQEKEAAMSQMKRELTEPVLSLRSLLHLNEQVAKVVGLLADVMPFVPPEDRAKLLDKSSTNLSPHVNNQLIRLAQEAPDLSRPEARRGLVYTGYLIKGTSKKSD